MITSPRLPRQNRKFYSRQDYTARQPQNRKQKKGEERTSYARDCHFTKMPVIKVM